MGEIRKSSDELCEIEYLNIFASKTGQSSTRGVGLLPFFSNFNLAGI